MIVNYIYDSFVNFEVKLNVLVCLDSLRKKHHSKNFN